MPATEVYRPGALDPMTKSSKKRNDVPIRVKDSLWVKIGAAAAAVAAIIAVVALTRGGEADTEQRVNSGDCNVQGDQNVIECKSSGESIPGEALDKKLREDAARFADVKPSGNGPWPFAVVGTLGQGLKVREYECRCRGTAGGPCGALSRVGGLPGTLELRP